MKILLTGANGQLGQELQKTKPLSGFELVACSRIELDVTAKDYVLKKIQALKPDCIINTAAYTAVDAAEQDATSAFLINSQGAANLALAAREFNCRLIHISTDYVFDGTKATPYTPEDKPNPVNKYGMSKWEGEQKIQTILPQNLILRAGWLYGAQGDNFVKTILQLLKTSNELRVINDQLGTPTWVRNFARVIWLAVQNKHLAGTYHFSDEGMASWYDFAVAIQEQSYRLKLITKKIPIHPVTTKEYPLPAIRPQYAVLDKTSSLRDFAIEALSWTDALQQMLGEMKNG